MKIMLVCAGGCSTSILMNKMKKYAEGEGMDLSIEAFGIGEYASHLADYECVLLGPQIAYKKAEIEKNTDLPVAVINTMDYAMGKVENIFSLAKSLGLK